MKKSVKVSVLASAFAAVCALSAAVSATEYIDNSGVYYDNMSSATATGTGVYYDNSINNTGVYYDGTGTSYSNTNNSGVYYNGTTVTSGVYYDGVSYSEPVLYNKTGYVVSEYPTVSLDTNELQVSYTKLSDAEYAVGFYFDDIPSSVVYDLRTKKYTVIDNSIIQIKYSNKYGDAVAIRKGMGKADVSGDRTKYDVTKTIRIGDVSVKYSGYKYTYGRTTITYYHLATWYKDGYSYSVKTNIPMSLSEIQSIAEDMISQ